MPDKHRLSVFVMLIGIVVFSCQPAIGQTLTVGPGQPFQSVQAAVDAAAEWDEIVVMQGVYTENIDIDKAVTLRADGDAGVVIRAAVPTDHAIDIQSDYVTVEGFTIFGAEQESAAIFINNHHFCMIMENQCGASSTDTNYIGIMLLDADGNYLRDNVMVSNLFGVVLLNSETGDGSQDNTIIGNVCAQNSNGGIVLINASANYMDTNQCTGNGGPGISLYQSSQNYVNWNESNGNFIGIDIGGGDNVVVQNTCNGNQYGLLLGSGVTDNAVVFNKSESNQIGILSLNAANNRIYMNTFQGNSAYQALSYASTNQWRSQEPITYYYGGLQFQRYLGNYFGGHDPSDTNNDAIADLPYPIPGGNSQDANPLIFSFEEYDFIYPAEY